MPPSDFLPTGSNTPGQDFSIVVPCFNSAATICETLKSIQTQSHGLERVRSVILADDCSSDDTVAVAERWWECKVPLKVRRNKFNRGEYRNLNAAVSSLDKDIHWFFIVHADDIVKPNWLDVMVRNIDAAGPSLATITSSWDVLNPDGSITFGESKAELDKLLVPGGRDPVGRMLLRGCWWKITSCCIRTATFVQLNGVDASYSQSGDVDFCLRLLSSGWDLLYIPMSLCVYRVHAQSVTARNRRQNLDLEDDFWIFKRFIWSLSQSEVRHCYFRKLHSAASRAMHSFRSAEFKRAAVAAKIAIQIYGSFIKDATHAFKYGCKGLSPKPFVRDGMEPHR
jgi:glycosyltransferase involved in cell wall biosynthesis